MTDEMTSLDLETRKKRLVYRSNYRGFREADLILGGYAKANIESMSEEDVLMFEHLLGAKDHDNSLPLRDYLKGLMLWLS